VCRVTGFGLLMRQEIRLAEIDEAQGTPALQGPRRGSLERLLEQLDALDGSTGQRVGVAQRASDSRKPSAGRAPAGSSSGITTPCAALS
jgi:hypothetical protein